MGVILVHCQECQEEDCEEDEDSPQALQPCHGCSAVVYLKSPLLTAIRVTGVYVLPTLRARFSKLASLSGGTSCTRHEQQFDGPHFGEGF